MGAETFVLGEGDGQVAALPSPWLLEATFSTPVARYPMITDDALYEACGVRIAFATRLGGMSAEPYRSMNVSDQVGDVPPAVRSNRRNLLESLNACEKLDTLVVPKQVHGTHIVTVGEDLAAAQQEAAAGADGVVCAAPEVPVMVYTADCVPVVIVAPTGAFAVLHAGRAGSLAGIAGKGLTQLAAQEGVEPSACNCYLGPHIGACCYEVGREIVDEFTAAFGAECDAGDGKLDLTAANVISLVRAGAVPKRIIDAAVCTSCRVERYFSHRAENGVTGRQATLVYRRLDFRGDDE